MFDNSVITYNIINVKLKMRSILSHLLGVCCGCHRIISVIAKLLTED